MRAGESSSDEDKHTIRIFLLDEHRQRIPNAPYRLEIGGEVRTGMANGAGQLEERNVTLSGECSLEWWAESIRFSRTLKTESSHENALHNLGYLKHASFKADYADHEPTHVHDGGTPRRTA